MKKLFTVLFVCCLLSILCLSALAGDAASATSADPAVLAAFLRETIFPIVGALLLGLLSIPLHWLGNRFKIDYLLQRDNAIERLAYQGIALAEEMAAKKVEGLAGLTGSAKLDVAVGHILSVMPSVSREQAERIVESLLAQIPGVGATKDQVVTRDVPLLGLASAAIPGVPSQAAQ
ncbi:hypothetical protein [Geobacter sp. SVR]|uniref:hypothetical protein n=1 Tax=Geobacter sp. SVR TaxID=2495594 RepID=UPI00143EF6CE|nr:hypothetical protein [Geobacter sp. SVR]BCS54543.1 hypothetical protein GSVR_28510 [Geobacter sp. SVR]GCF87143.1 hypothetical protein GSbR_37430 [Geobacter sp. SVR]